MFGRRRPVEPADGHANPEAHRAEEALRLVRQMRHARAATPEWRALARRRRRRSAVRTVATAFLGLAGVALLVGVALGARAGFAWLRGHTDLFTVHHLAVTGTEKLQPADILRVAGVAAGDDILALNPDSLARRVARLPQVRSVTARRTWKREVLFQVAERHPVANVLLDRLWQVDEEGVVLPGEGPDLVEDLPIIRGLGVDPVPPGTRLIAPGLGRALALVRSLGIPELGLDQAVSEVIASEPDSLVMTLMADGVPVRVGRGDIPPRRLMALRAVLDDLARQNVEAEYLDLRFAGQVVVMPVPEVEEAEDGAAGPEKKAGGDAGRSGAAARGRRSRHGRNT